METKTIIIIVASVIVLAIAALYIVSNYPELVMINKDKTVVINVRDSSPHIRRKAEHTWSKDHKRIHAIQEKSHRRHPDGVTPHQQVMSDLHLEN